MSSLPAQFVHLVDDAAIFPPGNMPLDRAVAAYAEHRRSEYADLIGGFVVSDLRLPELIELLGDADETAGPMPVNVVVSGGAGAIEGAVRWASRAPALDLRAVEFALRDEDDLAHNAMRALAMFDTVAEELGDAEIYVEPPRVHGEPTYGWTAALDELAAREVMLKFRLGGVDPADVPEAAEVAACIDAALDRELRFKCTAGLHHGVRAPGRHGFLNVMVATVASLDGGDVVAALEETDGADLAESVRQQGERSRRWFRSFGCCDVLEPHEDLVDLGLVNQ
ncbi:MAG TPA: hypothetical protein VF426_01430 [Marmoricola sp.]